jgi:hypothetical protein
VREHGFSVKALGRGWDQGALTYAIWDREFCKLGRCKGSPLLRLKDLQCGSSRPLRLLAYSGSVTERAVHGKLHAHRGIGEWFALGPVLREVAGWDWLNCELYRELRALCASS